MKIRILAADPQQRAKWFNKHVGAEFEVSGIAEGSYVVDLTKVVENGSPLAGKGLVPFAFAERLDWPEEAEDALTSALEYPPLHPAELGAVEIDAWRAPVWPKAGNTPARLSPQEIGRLFASDVDGRFYGRAREHVLRMIWMCRRLLAEKEELRERLAELEGRER